MNPFQGLKRCIQAQLEAAHEATQPRNRHESLSGIETGLDRNCILGLCLEIDMNPFQGLKPAIKRFSYLALRLEIDMNPFQGLKRARRSRKHSQRNRLEIDMNPFQGLKLGLRSSSRSLLPRNRHESLSGIETQKPHILRKIMN